MGNAPNTANPRVVEYVKDEEAFEKLVEGDDLTSEEDSSLMPPVDVVPDEARHLARFRAPTAVLDEEPVLPMPASAEQVWGLPCCSRALLSTALGAASVTAVRGDVITGTYAVDGFWPEPNAPLEPIMAHKPHCVSDLPFDTFLHECMATEPARHMKVEFKEIGAVEYCLKSLDDMRSRLTERGQAVWISADILCGPGCRDDPLVCADAFLRAVARNCPWAPLSLGWCADPCATEGYTRIDCINMVAAWQAYRGYCADPSTLFLHHSNITGIEELDDVTITEPPGVVFQAFARLVSRDPVPIIELLQEVEDSHLVLFTGPHEGRLPRATLRRLKAVFEKANLLDRVGFDCQVRRSPLRSMWYWLGKHCGGCFTWCCTS
eukprot:TRINITY_DN49581_c0_g1_i1.p1 TRINITY_DN49581_c0_g1~~TRINITY_DN49581_c0_g1_i1.p1  ORF type:complete len:378 (-),score=64.27 TRINITY_DN49581_c0_g1_i1:196-1329(-)